MKDGSGEVTLFLIPISQSVSGSSSTGCRNVSNTQVLRTAGVASEAWKRRLQDPCQAAAFRPLVDSALACDQGHKARNTPSLKDEELEPQSSPRMAWKTGQSQKQPASKSCCMCRDPRLGGTNPRPDFTTQVISFS